ncbi:hypothetical protein ACTXMK_04940 [Psychrobacter celer]|uniref:hypothetical protein n=1 Tax=Psychrobacter celer TaxID=306572 RepID=UPI003FD0D0A4
MTGDIALSINDLDEALFAIVLVMGLITTTVGLSDEVTIVIVLKAERATVG